MKSLKALKGLLVLSLLAFPVAAAPGQLSAASAGNQLLLKKNSDIMFFNGTRIKAAQPVTIKEDSAYLPLNGISAPFGFTLYYDVSTREAVARTDQQELRFKAGSAIIKVDGREVKGPGPVFNQNGYMMVPIRMWSNLTGSRIAASGTDITIEWEDKVVLPEATFAVGPDVIYAQQTPVIYTDLAKHPGGLRIVEERWEGKEDIFMTSGRHTITRWVRDEEGNWSEPYSVTVFVREPNRPPVADFVTDKATYRIGEHIRYIDRSHDDEDSIVDRKWTGNEDVFFESGDKQVTLQVVDQHGLTGTVTKTIHVSDEVLYTRNEYDMLFTPTGGKYAIDGGEVLAYETVPYTLRNEGWQLVRSNSPETWVETGILYDTLQSGNTRFLFYNDSALNYNVKMYLLATNISGSAADVGVGAWGKGGPDPYSTNAGKMSTLRYMDALNKKTPVTYTTLRPGETKVILPELSEVPVKPKQVFSAYADIISSKNIRYRVVVVPEHDDPIASLDRLKLLERDNKHTRGTFNNADRSIVVNDQLGGRQRMVIGDSTVDTYLDGIDDMTGLLEKNLGNFGVLYKAKLRVAPRTLIGVNARGGHYTGGFIVNGELVEVTKNSILKDQNEVGVLYRTGNRAETVDIVFTLASGSHLPINMVFLPLPEERR